MDQKHSIETVHDELRISSEITSAYGSHAPRGNLLRDAQRPEPQSGSGSIPTQSMGTMSPEYGKLVSTISLIQYEQ